MEAFINNTHSLRECYSKHNYESLKGENSSALGKLCFSEKVELAKALQTINMKDNIKERLRIVSENRNAEANERKEQLDNAWK